MLKCSNENVAERVYCVMRPTWTYCFWQYHKTSVVIADNFVRVTGGQQTDVLSQLDADRLRQIQQNRAKLTSIIKTVIFCGRQELALRGKDDSGSVLQQSDAANDGNFRSLEISGRLRRHYSERSSAVMCYKCHVL